MGSFTSPANHNIEDAGDGAYGLCACAQLWLCCGKSSLPCICTYVCIYGYASENQVLMLMHDARNCTGRKEHAIGCSVYFQELKKQVETVIEREKKLKSELKKKENDLKTELENCKVCSASKVSL